MDFNDYFAKRSELTMRVLVEMPQAVEGRADHRFVVIGGMCLLAAAGLQVWASRALIDPGYFARMSIFLSLVLLAGVIVLVVAKAASTWSIHVRVRAREVLRERTVARLINADRSIALKLAVRDA